MSSNLDFRRPFIDRLREPNDFFEWPAELDAHRDPR
jgi:hypothetical protein